MPSPFRRYWAAFAALFVIVLAVSVAYIAQAERDETKKEPAPNRPARQPLDLSDEDIRDVTRAFELYTLDKAVGLTEEQWAAVLPKWRTLMEMRRAFWAQRRARFDALAATLEDVQTNKPEDGDTQLAEAFASFRQQDDAFWSEHRQIEDAILDVLAPEQRVQYILTDEAQPRKSRELVRALRRLTEETRESHRPRQDAPPAP